MTEDYSIQCDNCGTLYSSEEDVCPYCGQPQPLPVDDDLLPPTYAGEQQFLDSEYAENFPPYPGDAAWTGDETEAQQSAYTYDEEVYFGQAGDYPSLAEEYGEPVPAYPGPDYILVGDRYVISGDETGYNWRIGEGDYGQDYPTYPVDEALELELTEEALPRRFTWARLTVGCLGLFICIGLLYGGVALVAAYNGLRERALTTRAEAELHYQRGQEHLANNAIELAIAEFEMALSLNPNFLPAREALRQAQSISLSRPTPTSETRSAAAASLLADAESQAEQQQWAEALLTLAQVRDLDPDYQSDRVSELVYTASYQLGLQQVTPGQVEEALASFELALAERPDDQAAAEEAAKASLYIEGRAAETTDLQKAVDAFSLLYRKDNNYLDVKTRLAAVHNLRGDELAADGDWCLAEVQYLEAADIQEESAVSTKAQTSQERCKSSKLAQASGTPPPRATQVAGSGTNQATPSPGKPVEAAVTAAPAEAASTGGGGLSIVYSAYNVNETRWEIVAVPVSGGAPRLLVTNGTMPAVSPNSQSLVYHSELIEAEGFHRFDLASGEDSRITIYTYHILPRWGGNERYLFVAQEPGTGRWQVHLGFADGKSDPIILRDGRTPDWSPDESLIAYQGTDPAGNNPGIYLVSFGGGEATRLTSHESDRSPDFSPDGSRLAYMSTQDGNWNIYTVDVAGGTPRQLTTASGNDGLPIWSPDGSQIAYVSDMDGSWGIYVVSASGGAPRKVTAWDGAKMADWLLGQIAWIR